MVLGLIESSNHDELVTDYVVENHHDCVVELSVDAFQVADSVVHDVELQDVEVEVLDGVHQGVEEKPK